MLTGLSISVERFHYFATVGFSDASPALSGQPLPVSAAKAEVHRLVLLESNAYAGPRADTSLFASSETEASPSGTPFELIDPLEQQNAARSRVEEDAARRVLYEEVARLKPPPPLEISNRSVASPYTGMKVIGSPSPLTQRRFRREGSSSAPHPDLIPGVISCADIQPLVPVPTPAAVDLPCMPCKRECGSSSWHVGQVWVIRVRVITRARAHNHA
jgi:hypothetical protein